MCILNIHGKFQVNYCIEPGWARKTFEEGMCQDGKDLVAISVTWCFLWWCFYDDAFDDDDDDDDDDDVVAIVVAVLVVLVYPVSFSKPWINKTIRKLPG